MRTLVRITALGMLVAGFAAAPAFAQCDPEAKAAQYDIFNANRKVDTIDGRKLAIEAGKKFLEMCKDSAEDKEYVDFINKTIPRIEDWIKWKPFNDRKDPFLNAAKAKNYAAAFTAAKDLLPFTPSESETALDLVLYLASAGEALSTKADGTSYIPEALNYAKESIRLIESGRTSKEWGHADMTYSMKDPAESRSNALGWMNLTTALLLSRQKQDKEAMDFYYRTTTIPSSIQNDPVAFNAIGDYYFDEASRLQKEVQQKFDLATETDIAEGKRLLGIARAYAERGVDALARAQAAFTKAGKKEAADKANLKATALYALRFSGKTEGKDEFVAGLMQKPMPSPSSELVPVPEDPAPVEAPSGTPPPTQSN